MVQVLALAALLFGLGAVFGAPWLPTRKREVEVALGLLDLKPGQTVVDLGSGTGNFMLAAAKRGLKVVGYEINPLLYAWSYMRTWPYRKQVRVKLGNFWTAPLIGCDGIFVFLIGRYMDKLSHKLTAELKEPTKVTSFVFQIPGKEVLTEERGVFLYQY